MFNEQRFLYLWISALLGFAGCSSLNPETPDAAPADMVAPELKVEIAVKGMGTGSGIISSAPSGISCGTTCKSLFPVGKPVQIVASPDFQSSFEGFAGGCTGMQCMLTPTTTEPQDIYAVFKRLSCMPSSTMGCNYCPAGASWVPGVGTATCGPDGAWGSCALGSRPTAYIGPSSIIHDCKGSEMAGSWVCSNIINGGITMKVPAAAMAPGKYYIYGGDVRGELSAPSYIGATLTTTIYDSTNGKVLNSGTMPNYTYSNSFSIFGPTITFTVPDKCPNIYVMSYFSIDGSLPIKNFSATGFTIVSL